MLEPLRSRMSIILVFGAMLLALDVGRSIWARVVLEFPSSEYRPAVSAGANNSAHFFPSVDNLT